MLVAGSQNDATTLGWLEFEYLIKIRIRYRTLITDRSMRARPSTRLYLTAMEIAKLIFLHGCKIKI